MRTLLAIVWAILALVLGWRAVTVKAPAIEEDIRARTTEVVAPLNANATVDVDGRFVTVRGPEADDAAKAKTLGAAKDIWGALGPWDGLWVPKAVAAVVPIVSAVKDTAGLVLSGAVGSEDARTAIAGAAKAAFAGTIDNRLTISEAAATADLPGLADAFGALAKFDRGSAVVSPDRTILSGATGDRAASDAAGALAANPGWSVYVQGPAADPSAARVAELEAALEALKGEAAAAKARIAELEGLAAGGDEAARKLLADLEAARAELGTVKADLETAKAALDTANKRIAELEAAGASTQADLAAARQAQAECTANADAAAKAAVALRAEFDAAKKRIAELEIALAAKPAEPAPPAAAPALTAEACNAAMTAAVAGRSVNFETGSAVIASDANAVLDAAAAAAIPCAKEAGLKVEVAGHTDDRGEADANLALSQRRAEAVRNALVSRNVPPESISAKGYGETSPVADNATAEGRAANRRIEFNWTSN